MPMPAMKTVNSTRVWQIGYDAEAKTLYMRFTPSKRWPGGRVAVYQGVPPETAAAIVSAPSIGQEMDTSLKGIFPFSYL